MTNSEDFLYVLKSDTEVLGTEIAEQVADKLEKGFFLGYRHRDYCGMAMSYNEEEHFLYGELYDGIDFSFPLVFKSRKSFVEWLSKQSTASLARLDADEFYQGNQIITRKRLLEFISERSPI
ncbi:hypothetical protein V2E39_17760 [Chryseobacterium arthrosphaerae]|uniref:Uncharacterized protein n=1 Tax=Chryseobacterium arthrosphaerae TaxID=651561 RepID=A0ABU7R356_9FLAO|nr:hypothetical protein [Chryseobacterium arthrosphaerae]